MVRKLLLSLLSVFLFAGICEAQIVTVHFPSEKVAKRYKKFTTILHGEIVLLGEPVPGGGIEVTDKGIRYHRAGADPRANEQNELFVLNPKDPEAVPYEIEDGKKVPTTRKSVAAVPGSDIAQLSVFMRTEDIQSLAKEYRFRKDRIERARTARDAEEKGSVPWFERHRLVVLEYQRLQSWLEEISFSEAAKKLQKELDKEAKVSKKDALNARWKTAIESVHDVDTPEALVEASKEITGGKLKFHAQESQHVRFLYIEEIGDKRVTSLLQLAEELIEGFRIEFVDPYVDDEFPDQIPDDIFIEYWFGSNDPEEHRRFLEDYYYVQVKHLDRHREIPGRRIVRTLPPQIVNSWRYYDGRDLEGIVLHTMGHALADMHFNGTPHGMNQPWMHEGLGYYLSFEYTGRNTVTCKEFRESTYVRPAGEEGLKTVMIGLRDMYNGIALDKGPRFDKMALKYLFDFEDADLAKSWSMFDWIAKDLGKEGQIWLREGCIAARDRAAFIADWREVSEEIFDVKGKDVFKVIDDLWRAYAKNQQDTSETFRRRKKR